jgi:DNA-binding NarL/FixJ family response regulator
MPKGGGRAVIESVHSTHPDIPFLAISASDAPEDVVATVRAGARGYVTKTVSPADLSEAIRRVVDGDAVFSPKLAGFVLDAFAAMDVKDLDPELDKLTKREREVLQHIARGYTYREVGEQLFISAKTVENHMSAVLRKLQLSNRRELTRWAQDRDLI